MGEAAGGWVQGLMGTCALLPACSWAVQQQQYHGRVGSIPLVFQAAAADLAQQQQQGTAAGAEVSPEVVAAVWEQLLPGELPQRMARLWHASPGLEMVWRQPTAWIRRCFHPLHA